MGNPILDAVLEKKIEADLPKFTKEKGLPEKEIIALLPGSRKAEISYLLPVMLEASEAFPQYQFVIAGAPNMDASFYETFTRNYPVKVLWDKTYEIVQNSKAAMVASGTATLEVAILNTPQVVCYKNGRRGFLSFTRAYFYHPQMGFSGQYYSRPRSGEGTFAGEFQKKEIGSRDGSNFEGMQRIISVY